MGLLNRLLCGRRTHFLVLIVTSALMIIVLHSSSQSMTSFARFPAVIRSVLTQDANKTGVAKSKGGIPKIIHQIWKDDVIPEVFQENIKGLVKHNKPPEWQYFFWTDETGAQFIKKYFPDLVHRFSTARNILKADILRLAAIYHYGGVYFDLDTVSVKPLDPYVETHDCSFTTDPPEHIMHYFFDDKSPGQIITNCVILCKPGNWFIWHVMEQLFNQSEKCNDPIKCVGPGIITKEYQNMRSTINAKDLPPLENYQLFTDKIDLPVLEPFLTKRCNTLIKQSNNSWQKDVCQNFVQRGGASRNISELAYSYHIWFHTGWRNKKVKQGKARKVSEIVPHVKIFTGEILKADILRLAVIYHYGGVYFDLDTVSVKPLDPYVETHDCSFTTDPPEHILHYLHNKNKPGQIITNCVILCKPGNWFVWHVMEQLFNQSEKCRDAIKCVGPGIITNEYQKLQSTNKSKDLPHLENTQLFTDKIDLPILEPKLTKTCNTLVTQSNNSWQKEICQNFLKRGGAARNISEYSYSYHIWFHTSWHEIRKGTFKKIREFVPHVTLFTG